MMVPWFLLGRIATATALGGVIGFERDRHGRPAGLRTHMVVALASATFMAVSTHFLDYQNYPLHSLVAIDVSRIAASIVTGIGFLGGGAIMRNGVSVQGLTTAAGLWLVGAIGMAAGSGMFVVAIFATIVGLIALGVLRRFEDKEGTLILRRMLVVMDAGGKLDEVLSRLHNAGARWKVRGVEADHASASRRAELDLFLPADANTEELLKTVEQVPQLRSARIEAQER